ncbi:DEAD/DEAH box helicase [Nonomuraea rhodomycinica]|uniref:DEAD/DEAH box helicase n=1 Tax=Nonomuraea rhodomycinica TaxID=1712872 RepID=A0A7Y6IUQ7_9ACTN|nr:DEAD/DEAH box helicase [Nonomuraea rhodomycinica]NUW44752.1 DEAD/DEAH box helicase [Nonomuraea rhodomycinica]
MWPHQYEAADLAYRGRNVIISTGTASGKSLAYLTPAVTSCLDGGTVLYLTPTKALAADQFRGLRELRIAQVRAATFDGDTPFEERTWVRQHANYVLTNPDMLHRSILPRHSQWSSFFRRLRLVVVDECHNYRGVFGSHVAQILRRLRRICARYGSGPVFMLASATASEPGAFARRLTGLEMDEVTVDASPKGATTFALWEPPLTELRGEGGAPVRRTATAEAADLLADLVLADVRTLAFVRSRRGAETVALSARAKLADVAFSLSTGRHGLRSSGSNGHREAAAPPQLLGHHDLLDPHFHLNGLPGRRSSEDDSSPLSPAVEPSAGRTEGVATTANSSATDSRTSPGASPKASLGASAGASARDVADAAELPGIVADAADAPGRVSDAADVPGGVTDTTELPDRVTNAVDAPGRVTHAADVPSGVTDTTELPDRVANAVDAPGRVTHAADVPSGVTDTTELPDRVTDPAELTGDITDATELPGRVAAYRAGYLAEDRRELEKALRSGSLMGLATTNALELGVDVSGLDAVLIAGWPGTRASLWQQAGRAGRDGQDALAVLIARDDPLDTYLVHHPEALFGRPVEAIVLDPDNPYVLGPHLCAAAAEIPLTEDDLATFGPTAPELLDDLVAQGLLRRRPAGWFWTRRERATDLADIRGAGGAPIQVVEASTGRLLGSVDEPSAHTTVHTGAVYLHQGETFLVEELDLEAGVALVSSSEPDYATFARDVTDISVLSSLRSQALGRGELHFGEVEVTRQVVSYLKRRLQSGEMLGDEPLDLPPRTLRTRAVWWTLPASVLVPLAEEGIDLGGAAHAAEHASIGLLPLFATCDRWDIGGVSTELHADTGLLTVFVYDGHEGGAGFAERGFARAADWLTATREAIASCECERGCPSCIQSPKCGNGNEPLHKRGAIRLLNTLLGDDVD